MIKTIEEIIIENVNCANARSLKLNCLKKSTAAQHTTRISLYFIRCIILFHTTVHVCSDSILPS